MFKKYSQPKSNLGNVLAVVMCCLTTLHPSLSYSAGNWTSAPVTIGNGQHPQIVTDATGIATAIWISNDPTARVQASRFINAAWTTPVNISTTGNASHPRLIISGNGIVTAVWQQQTNDDSVIYASRFNGNWSTPTAISAASGNAVHPQVTVDGNGIVTTVWQQLTGNQSLIQAGRFTGSAWTSPTAISAVNAFSQFPEVLALGNGDVLAVWGNFPAGLGGSTDSLIQGTRWNGSSWTLPVSISEANHHAQTPRLAPSGSGAQTVWQQDDGNLGWVIASAMFTSSNWSIPVMLTPTGEFARHPVVRGDETGKVWAVWERNEGLYWSVRGATFANGSWSAPSLLESSTNDQRDPTLGVDNQGTGIAVWQRDDGSYDRIHSVRSTNSGWTGGEDISDANQNAQAPQIVTDSLGNATVVWQAFTGGSWVIQSKRGYQKLVGLFSAILPTARSVQVGQPATAFGTIVNATGSPVTGCYLALPSNPLVAATFSYQTTNANNALIGTANTPVNIPVGGSQGFVFGITPTGSFNATNIPIVFDCSNTNQAPSQTGLNTFLLSASATPTPDMIAIGGTTSNDAVLRIPSPTGIHAFGTAAVNIGASGLITATADTGGVNLPLTITICQTNSSTGACLAPPSSSVSSTVNTNQSATYAVFVKADGAVAFNPAVNRIFLRLSSGGIVRGATSVAVTTGG